MLDGAARLGKLFDRTAEMGMPALAMTDHGNVFGAHDFYRQARAAGVNPIIGMEAYLTPNTSRFEQDPGALGRRWRRRCLRRRRLHPHDSALGEHAGHAQPVPVGLPRLARGLLLQAAGRPGTAGRVRQGADRHHRLPVRRGPDLAADRQLRQGGGLGCRIPGHLRQGELLPGADGPRPVASRPGSAMGCCGWPGTCTCRWWPPTTCTTPNRRTRTRTRRCCACSPARLWTTRTASSSTRGTSTSSRRPRCARCGTASTTCGRPATTPC